MGKTIVPVPISLCNDLPPFPPSLGPFDRLYPFNFPTPWWPAPRGGRPPDPVVAGPDILGIYQTAF